MTEADLRATLLLRAFERTPDSGCAPEDLDWAGREAKRQVGEPGEPRGAEAWLARRARLGLQRLGERAPDLQPALLAGGRWPGRGTAVAVLLLAFLAGLVADPLGGQRQINLLAPPLLGLLAWNGAVYALLALQALAGLGKRAGAAAAGAGPLRSALLAALRRASARLVRRWLRPAAGAAGAAAALARFGADWWSASRPLQAARLAALLHAAAACLALGALAALYARGLVLDYRAGWDSTLLDAAGVQRLLGWVLGPAAALSGQPLPQGEAWAALRLASGGGAGGADGAARWLHLWALTLAAAVVLPRALLACWAGWQARRLAARLPLPPHDDLQGLLRSAAGRPRPVWVLPYSYRLDAARQAALPPVLDALLGPGVQARVQPGLPLGAEDALDRWLPPWPAAPGADGGTVAPLFALTATPEPESHGALLRALAAALPAGLDGVVLVDESGFRQRLGAAPQRLAQRRAAWQALGHAQAPRWRLHFIDLSAGPAGPGHPTAPTAPAAAA